MKNTLIPLDIAFWNDDERIVDIFTMEPCRKDPCPLYTPTHDYVAAVEMNAGVLRSSGIKIGDIVTFSPAPARQR
jgi:uncharacterized membrane protein (UPF0127 family)